MSKYHTLQSHTEHKFVRIFFLYNDSDKYYTIKFMVLTDMISVTYFNEINYQTDNIDMTNKYISNLKVQNMSGH